MSKAPPPSGPPKTATPPAARPAPPPPPPSTQGPPAAQGRTFTVQTGRTRQARRIVLYGPGGVGKSTLASLIAKVGIKPLFLDLAHGTDDLETNRLHLESFQDVRGALASDIWDGFEAVCLDTMTDCEELITDWVISNVPHEKAGRPIKSIEDYGFGKGYRHNYSQALALLGDFDRHIRMDRHVVIICHECTTDVPNPNGDSFLRYEPRLQSPKSGKDSIRHRLVEWCDDMFFVNFDQHVNDDGKAIGSGSRTIYGTPLPTHWAKARRVKETLSFQHDQDATLWEKLLG